MLLLFSGLYLGCYGDSRDRALPFFIFGHYNNPSHLDVVGNELCIRECSKNGSTFAATEVSALISYYEQIS
jgi:hypothetical protein